MRVHDLITSARAADRIAQNLLKEGSAVREELVGAGRFGGYFCLADRAGFPLLVTRIGEPGDGKREKYLAFCQEKARRLAGYPNHDLSRQSRNLEVDHFSGAARGNSSIGAFSGFPEDLDEVVSVLDLVALKDLSYDQALRMLKHNPYLERLGRKDIFQLIG